MRTLTTVLMVLVLAFVVPKFIKSRFGSVVSPKQELRLSLLRDSDFECRKREQSTAARELMVLRKNADGLSDEGVAEKQAEIIASMKRKCNSEPLRLDLYKGVDNDD